MILNDIHRLMVLFVYGFSFYLLGVTLLFFSSHSNGFKFRKFMWFIAVFGLAHGVYEWMQMFLVYGQFLWSAWVIKSINYTIIFFLSSSYLYLFGAGLSILFLANKKSIAPLNKILFCLSVVGAVVLMPPFFLMSNPQGFMTLTDILMRYFLGFPGALLTGWAFLWWRKQPEIQQYYFGKTPYLFIFFANLFFLYALLAGLITPKATFFPASIMNYDMFSHLFGIPIQLFRTGCALGLSVCVVFIVWWEKAFASTATGRGIEK